MPIYEYECQTCHHRFEAKQKFSDPPLTTCDRCGQSVRKLISAPAIMFKGTGWYITDYSNKLKPEGTGDAADTSSAAKPAEKSEPTKTQTSEKPAPKADSPGTSSAAPAPASADPSPKATSHAATSPS